MVLSPIAPTAKSGTPLLSTSPIFSTEAPNLASVGRVTPIDSGWIINESNIVEPPSPRCRMYTAPSVGFRLLW